MKIKYVTIYHCLFTNSTSYVVEIILEKVQNTLALKKIYDQDKYKLLHFSYTRPV